MPTRLPLTVERASGTHTRKEERIVRYHFISGLILALGLNSLTQDSRYARSTCARSYQLAG